ncbi:MAG: hypothetical protein FJW40_16200 [Acidobacteria bacterium]|nr:hypothetical protein [Acidobacteriota bacterium]
MRYLSLLLSLVQFALAQAVPGRYVVELDAPAAGKNAQRYAAVASQQAAARTALADRGIAVRDSFDTLMNALVVDAPDAQAAALAALPGVRRVYPVFEVQMHLDRALGIHRVPQAWARMGAQRAGAGIKIGIIDSGIDSQHPAFQTTELKTPEGFPKVNAESDREFTNGKVIVARNYEEAYGVDEAQRTARDRSGHGTGVAMAAAGVMHRTADSVEISGAAPAAWLGNYKVFPGANRTTALTSVVARALEDAVKDGMDIVNMSLGSTPAPRPDEDFLARAVERAVEAGVLVVNSAGNAGPNPNTLGSPGSAAGALTVGATWNSRVFATAVQVEGLNPVPALLPNAPSPREPARGLMIDAARHDRTGFLCAPAPPDAFKERIVLILRGGTSPTGELCTFELKLNLAQRAGAIAAVVFTDERPAVTMAVGDATLPAVMLTQADGLRIKDRLALDPAPAVIHFQPAPFDVDPDRIAAFSSRGPGPDDAVKPDLSAVGQDLLTATQSNTPGGELYDPAGYHVIDGTSFSAPIVAGAAAVVKADRPRLRPEQVKSLLVNTARTVDTLGPQRVGAGILDVSAALAGTLAAAPVSISLGTSEGTVDRTRELSLTNLSAAALDVTLSATSRQGSVQPTFSRTSLSLVPGQPDRVSLRWNASALPPGEYHGLILARSSTGETLLSVPYWLAVPTGIPAITTILQTPTTPRAGGTGEILFRVTDSTGTPVFTPEPRVEPVSGGITVRSVESVDRLYPGVFRLRVAFGPDPGANQFRIVAGTLDQQFQITTRP